MRTKKLIVIGTYIFAAILLSFFIYTYNCQAQESAPQPGQLLPGTSPEAMIYYSPVPLTTSRFVNYGRIISGKNGNEPDLRDKEKLTPEARDLYDRLLRVKSSNGFFALKIVVVQHSTIILLKYETIKWSDILPEIEKNFSALEN